MQTIQQPIIFIGGGNMARAIITGAINAQTLDPERVAVIDPNPDCHQHYKNPFADAQQCFSWLRTQNTDQATIVLAVKPQMLEAAVAPICSEIASLKFEPSFISILAGTTIHQLEQATNEATCVIRVMPNTPAQVGLGMSAIAPSLRSTSADIDLARELFSSIGKVIEIKEDLMNAFTALAGSGPAYIFYLAQAMQQAATKLGFDQAQASTIVAQTILGSATLMNQSDASPEALRAMVTSKGGTTHAATSSMDNQGVMQAIVQAIHAAKERGEELGKV